MEEKKTIFDYLGQVFCVFGIAMTIMAVFCLLFGEESKEISTMFALGNKGLSVETMGQFLGVTAFIVGLRFLFFTDVLIKTMSIFMRTLLMLISVVAVIGVFVYCFGWFPVDMWQAWLMFLVCFGISFAVSLLVMSWKEKLENRKMEEGLKKLKDKLEDTCA
ncbi:MAG: hypothetical protein J6K58_16140 [Lachnospiraceae bacterium]|nr:hypothetical protein [Lachnospiraceae bacterium]